MKNKVSSLKIPEVIVERLCNMFSITKKSTAISIGLVCALVNFSNIGRLDDFALHQITNIVQRKEEIKNYSIRFDEHLSKVLADYKPKSLTTSELVVYLLANFIYKFEKEYTPILSSATKKIKYPAQTKLLRISGSKWSSKMQDAIQNIVDTSNKTWETSIEVCAGALGIFANFKIADNEIINDIDLRKINTYKGIQKDFQKITLEMYVLSPDKEIFDTKKEELEKADKQLLESCGKDIVIPGIVSYLYLNLLSARNARTTYDKKNDETYRNYLKAIPLLHERLKETKIYNMDILELIEKNKNAQNTIFIVDPPYLNTNVYKNDILTLQNREFGYKEHVKLAKLLRQITKEGKNNDFIYFCRITATRKKNQKTKKTTNLASLPAEDRHMEGMIDDLYWGHGFYYIDIPYGTDGTIERIITSFKFNEAKEYGKREEDVNGKRGEDVK